MPKKKEERQLCVDDLRHAEYYEMQEIFDDLYAKSMNQEKFSDLMGIILSRENILLAYRNMKTNAGSRTPGTDGKTIRDIAMLTVDEVISKVRYIVTNTTHGYRPKPVRRKDIPKAYDSTKTRPLGIPCIWDRLIQQCIKQVMEPICEAKFSENSYGFRPNRSAEHAIAKTYRLMQRSHLHYVIEFDIKGFFDNVDHSKLMRQIWAMGIRDKHLLYVLRQVLKAPIKMPDGTITYPTKGTPQGGIISPLLANIVLNELDHWVESQWQSNPVTQKYHIGVNSNGSLNCGGGYAAMRKTRLKEMFLVRYADDFRVFCRTKTQANKTKEAIVQWLNDRLRLEVSPEKTRVVNVKHKYSEFLGFSIKVHPKGKKDVVKSHISKKQLPKKRQALVKQAQNIALPRIGKTELDEVKLYNSMVVGMQNYYRIATHISADCSILHRAVMTTLTNRLSTQKGTRLKRTGRPLMPSEKERYGNTRTLRYIAGTQEPIYPISYVQHKNPMNKRRCINSYTPDGRKEIHSNLKINTRLLGELMRQPLYDRNIEYADNRISLFSAQWGKCAVTGIEFLAANEIHCHHKTPVSQSGDDSYGNLTLILDTVHRLVHAVKDEVIHYYLDVVQPTREQLCKINELRAMAQLGRIRR